MHLSYKKEKIMSAKAKESYRALFLKDVRKQIKHHKDILDKLIYRFDNQEEYGRMTREEFIQHHRTVMERLSKEIVKLYPFLGGLPDRAKEILFPSLTGYQDEDMPTLLTFLVVEIYRSR